MVYVYKVYGLNQVDWILY